MFTIGDSRLLQGAAPLVIILEVNCGRIVSPLLSSVVEKFT